MLLCEGQDRVVLVQKQKETEKLVLMIIAMPIRTDVPEKISAQRKVLSKRMSGASTDTVALPAMVLSVYWTKTALQ